MKLTYYGHSCFAVEIAGCHLLFDPFITPNPLAAAIEPATIAADFILVSHGHFDHVADVVDIAQRTDATVIANFEIAEWFSAHSVAKTLPMNLGGATRLPFGRVKMIPALHSSVLPDGSYGGNPGGFLVETAEGSFVYSGDSALTRDYELLAGESSLSFAALCIGDHFTMGPDDAARAARMMNCRRVIGVHYDTFPPIALDREAARLAFQKRDIELLLPAIGESIEL